MTSGPISVVVTDANVLINFCHIGQLPLLGALTPYRFFVPQEVINEITDSAQQAEVESVSAAEADGFKAALETRHFVMPFASFGDLA